MGLFTRSERPTTRAITAATNPTPSRLKTRSHEHDGNTTAQAFQLDGARMFDTLGPIKYAANFQGNMQARVRLFAAVIPDDGDDPVACEQILDPAHEAKAPAGIPDDLMAQAIVELARIKSETEGQAAIQKDLAVNRFVTGEAFLTVVPDKLATDGERWQVFSIFELTRRGKTLAGDPQWGLVGRNEPLPDGTRVYRIYQPHPFRRRLADSSLRGVLDNCELLCDLNATFRSIVRSRVAQSGILALPSELNLPSSDEDDEDAMPQFFVDLEQHLTNPLANPNDPANVVPPFLEGNADYLDKVRVIELARPADPTLAAQQKEQLGLIAIGIDLPPEVLLGIGDVNHWGAFQVSEETWKAHGEPITISIAGQMGALVLRDLLTASVDDQGAQRWAPELISRIVVGYDPSNLIDHPDRGADALKLFQEFELSGAALRRENNFTEEDAPSPDETAKRTEQQRLIHARGSEPGPIPPGDVAGPGAPTPVAPVPGPPPKGPVAPDQTATSAPVAKTASAALVAASSRPVGHRLADLDLALYSRVHGMAQAAVRRQLEKAGAEITVKAQRRTAKVAAHAAVTEKAKSLPKHAVAASLGRAVVADLGLSDQDLIGDYTDLLDAVDSQVAKTRAAGLAALLAFLSSHGGAPSSAQLTEYEMQAQRDQQNGRNQLAQALAAFTLHQLYAPDTTGSDQGEGVEADDVPPGIVRGALATYGGQSLDADGHPDAEGAPLAGVAAGALNLGLASDLGAQVGLWQWQVGAPAHPFEPHQDLDGQIFDDGDTNDTSRANTSDAWIGSTSYFPGDHEGCQCSASYLVTYPTDDGGGQ